jgi:twitching motility two-component system response regulator PilH
VIICTSKGQETDRIWGLRQGAKDYLIKPIKQAELLGKIAELG